MIDQPNLLALFFDEMPRYNHHLDQYTHKEPYTFLEGLCLRPLNSLLYSLPELYSISVSKYQ